MDRGLMKIELGEYVLKDLLWFNPSALRVGHTDKLDFDPEDFYVDGDGHVFVKLSGVFEGECFTTTVEFKGDQVTEFYDSHWNGILVDGHWWSCVQYHDSYSGAGVFARMVEYYLKRAAKGKFEFKRSYD